MEVAKRIMTRSKAWERAMASTVCKRAVALSPKSSTMQLFSACIANCGREWKRPNSRKAFRRKRGNGATVNVVELDGGMANDLGNVF